MSTFAADYIASLPQGLASHPECTVKVQVLRDFCFGADPRALAEALPAAVRPLLDENIPVTGWVSEVGANVIFATLLDTHFGGDIARYVEHGHARNLALFGGVLYRAMFFVSSPERVLRRASDRWSTLRRGSQLTVLDRTPTSALLELRYPKNLLAAFMVRLRAVTFEDVITVAGGKDARVVVESHAPELAVFRGSWR